LKFFINFKQGRGKKIDSLIVLIKPSDFQKNASALYYYHFFAEINIAFKASDNTIQQLRNTSCRAEGGQ
jgi:hypothetical protein